MEGSARMQQELQEEIRLLRVRVAELEQAEKYRQQREHEQDQLLYSEREQREKLECEIEYLREKDVHDTFTHAEEQVLALEAVFDTITDGLAVYDKTGKIIRANTAYYHLLGIDHSSQYLTQTICERSKTLQLSDGHGEVLPTERWPLQRILNGEAIASGETADITISTLDGRKVLMDVSGAPIRDRYGNIVGAVSLYHDITERKKLEQRTTDSLHALLAMAEVLVQGTDQVNTDDLHPHSSLHKVLQRMMKLGQSILRYQHIGIILVEVETEFWQPVVVGSTSEEMQQWQNLLADTRLKEYIHNEQTMEKLLSGEPIKVDVTQQFGSEKQYFYFLVPMLVDMQLIGLISLDFGYSVHDLTQEELAFTAALSKLMTLVLERERLLHERAEAHANEQALLEANRRMDEFLSIASHELRTPLTTINGNIQLAKRRVTMLVPEDRAAQEDLDKVNLIQDLLSRAERQVRIQNRLVGDLLDVSRIQANRLELNMRACSLAAIVHEAVEDQRSSSPGRVIILDHLPENTSIPILADEDRISQVVTNFLTNALKYSASDRPVEVHVDVDQHYVRVAVRDEGPGLPPEEQKRLWVRFYRVPGIVVQSGSGVGLGLGLHICRTIIERHEGEIGVESEVGVGSTFWFTLPLAQSSEADAEDQTKQAAS